MTFSPGITRCAQDMIRRYGEQAASKAREWVEPMDDVRMELVAREVERIQGVKLEHGAT